MYRPTSDITIGGASFSSVSEVRITRGVRTPGATASVRIPVTAALVRSGKAPAMTETARVVKVGDEAVIRLGYDGNLRDEFRGYVRRVNYTTPLEIEMEDAYYLTRQRSVTMSGTTTLRDCIAKCGLTPLHVIDLRLKNFVVDERPVSWVLGKLKADYGLDVFFDMSGRVVAGRSFDVYSSEVAYELRRNVISDDDLKFRLASDVRLRVRAVCYMRDGTKVEAGIGEEGGAERTLHFYDVTSAGELKSLAEAELRRYSRDGYEGRITTFLEPYAEPCMIARLTDPVYNERDGSYYIEAVETTFGMGGGRREITLGIRM